MDFSNNYSLLQLETIFNILLDTDTKIKSSSASDAVLLTNCIFKIMETL
jgi:DNA polymerase III delta subunit